VIWILLVIFQFKHFIADYPLQTHYMLGKFKERGWVLPLAAHCAVHFAFTFIISFIFGLSLAQSILVATLDFSIHFVMDRIKASPKMLGRFNSLSKNEMLNLLNNNICPGELAPCDEEKKKQVLKSNVLFWWALGVDQLVHHLTDILLIYLIITL